MNVVLVHPEIPQNTGNIIRLCANTGARLHLISPLGFALDSAKMRRAGLDYHEFADVSIHASWPDFLSTEKPKRGFVFSTSGTTCYSCVAFTDTDYFIFGSESKGLPDTVLSACILNHRLRIPMLPHSRSLNLSNSVAVAVFEAWRQLNFERS